jgi:methyl-accepting chemotaxis protein
VKNGKHTAEILENSFTDINSSSEKVLSAISKVYEQTGKQTEQIHLINSSIMQIHDITEQNSEAASSTASSAEVLAVQSTTLGEVVNKLCALIEGEKEGKAEKKKGPAEDREEYPLKLARDTTAH